MSQIPYLIPGDSITADHWNALWEQMDAKLSAAMDGKSIYYWNYGGPPVPWVLSPWNNITGKRFFFLGSSRPVCDKLLFPSTNPGTPYYIPPVTPYDHSVYAAYKNQNVIANWVDRDDLLQVLVVKQPFYAEYSIFDESIEVLRQTSTAEDTRMFQQSVTR
jgi:hypothetical protein